MEEEKFLKNINTEEKYNEFLKFLFTKQDLKYRDFNKKIIASDIEIIGIRSPLLKNIVKTITKNEYENYLFIFEKLYNENKIVYYEEKFIYALVNNAIKEDFNFKIQRIDKVIKLIDNWAICDSFVSTAKYISKNKNKFLDFLYSRIDSTNLWELRFILVSLLDYIEKDYLKDIFKISEYIKNEDYYVKMAKAWLLSICFVKFKEETFTFLEKCKLDNWTINKTVQKIRESTRVEKEDKERILLLKRKEK